MVERPDLEAIRKRLHKAKSAFPDRPYPPRTFHQQVSDTAELLTYCQELEAENKRLRADIEEYSHTPEPELGPWS